MRTFVSIMRGTVSLVSIAVLVSVARTSAQDSPNIPSWMQGDVRLNMPFG